MPKTTDAKFTGGRIPLDLAEEIARRAKSRRLTVSVYVEAIFEFWNKIGRPDLEDMSLIQAHYEKTGSIGSPSDKAPATDRKDLIRLVKENLETIAELRGEIADLKPLQSKVALIEEIVKPYGKKKKAASPGSAAQR